MRRTPPGVRELKLLGVVLGGVALGRTPPGVRELKRRRFVVTLLLEIVAPLPGCVN